MACMEKKNEICSPLIPHSNALRKTCAEIVSEARQSLQVQSTKRPFTPRNGQRLLFGHSSVRANHESRPPSTFSIRAQHFDPPDSRPSSGTRLPPLDHKPKIPVLFYAEDPVKVFPKPPTYPLEGKKQLMGPRARLVRAGSLTILPSLDGQKDVKERRTPDQEQKQTSAGHFPRTDLNNVYRGLQLGPRRTASENRKKLPDVDLGTANRKRWTTEPWNGDKTTGAQGDAESLLWKHQLAALLQHLETMAAGSPERSVDHLCDLCNRLHGILSGADMLSQRFKERSRILRALFQLIDLNSARLNLHITKLCLALCVSGNNLLNICKLVFKISRHEINDVLFKDNAIIGSLLAVLYNEDVSASGEALLYCVGTLKFLSGNAAILQMMLDNNGIGVAQQLLQKLSKDNDTCAPPLAGHILVQLTATLRNLAEDPGSRTRFVSCILPELCTVLRQHCSDQDICMNISRIYSKLSGYVECHLALVQTPDCCQLFIELLSKHHQKQDLVVRLLFTLGNLTSKSHDVRELLFQCENCVDTLLQLYNHYQQRRTAHALTQRALQSDSKSPACAIIRREDEDVLVKLVRVLANMCIHPAVGPELATNADCVHLLMETLELRCVQESEELLVNVASTINNMAFYWEERSAIKCNRLTIAKLMLTLMLSSSADAILAATRVYGNLTQSKDVRDYVVQNKVHQFVVKLLDSKSTEVCFAACGVLTNVAQDPPNRITLALEGAVAKLTDCLRDWGAVNWRLAGQVCQALWNMVGSSSDTRLDTQEMEMLLDVLNAYLGGEYAPKWTDNEDERACWESKFLPVAHNLVKMLMSQHHMA